MKKVIYETTNGTECSKYDVEFKSTEINNTSIVLNSSAKDATWTDPGSKLGALFDNGNYVSINIEGKKIYLDYSQVEYIRLLLHAHDEANKVKLPNCYPTKLNKFKEYK